MNPSTGNVALNAAEWHLRRSRSYQDCEGREVRSRTVPQLQNRTPPALSWKPRHRSELYRASGLVQWPEAAQTNVRSNVGYWGISRLVLLNLSFSHFDRYCRKSIRKGAVELEIGTNESWEIDS